MLLLDDDDPEWIGNEVRARRLVSWNLYQRACAAKLDMLAGRALPYMRAYARRRTDATLWNHIFRSSYEFPRYLNPLADVITRVGVVYHRPARRALVSSSNPDDPEDAGTEDPTFATAMQEARADSVADRALKAAMACGGAIVWPYIEDGHRLCLRLITPDCFTPIAGWYDTHRLVGLRHTLYAAQDATREASRELIWDLSGRVIATEVYKVKLDHAMDEAARQELADTYGGMVEVSDGGAILEARIGRDYPYRGVQGEKVLPFACMKIGFQDDNYIFNPWEGDDLWDATLKVGLQVVQKLWITRHQSHRQLVLKGAKAETIGAQYLDPATPIVLAGDPGEMMVEVLTLAGEAGLHEGNIARIMEAVLVRRGWSYEEFTASAERMSAEARLLAGRDRNRYLAMLQGRCRDFELELAHAVRVVWNADTAGVPKMPMLAIATVDFANMDGQDTAANYPVLKPLVEDNLLSVVTLELDMNPDLGTREAALAAIQQNLRDNRMAKGFGFQAGQVAATIPAPNTPLPTTGEEGDDGQEDEPSGDGGQSPYPA